MLWSEVFKSISSEFFLVDEIIKIFQFLFNRQSCVTTSGHSLNSGFSVYKAKINLFSTLLAKIGIATEIFSGH